MNHINKIKISAGIAAVSLLALASAAYAAAPHQFQAHPGLTRPIVGTVSATGSGSLTLAVVASSTAAITTYTVETGNAKVLKAGTTTTVASIQVNDKIAVIGTVSGANITAKVIIDGIMPHTTGPPAAHKGGRTGSTIGRSFASSTRPFIRPAAFGSVSAIGSGSFSLAERTKTGTTTMTIDTDSSTTYQEGATTASFSNIAVGNLVAVTGTTTATDQILASKVMIMPAMSFGKGKLGAFKGKFNGKKPAASQ